MKRKATVGGKIVAKVFTEPDQHLAKTIDAAVRRAVREAFVAGKMYSYGKYELADRLSIKYGTKLGGA